MREQLLNIFLVKLFFLIFLIFIFFLIKKKFVAPGEHGFSFQVKMFTRSVSVLLTSISLRNKNFKKISI